MSTSSLTTIATILSNVFLSVVLVLINKRITVAYNFRFMTVLSGLHFATSFLSCFVLLIFGFMRYKNVNNFFSIFRISLGSMLSIVFMNYSLAHSSIGFYQISKLFCIPMTLFIESIFSMRQQVLTYTLIFSLSLIILGMMLVAEQEIKLNLTGIVWAFLGVTATSTAQIFFGPLKKGLDLDVLQLMFHTTPWLSFGTFMSIPLFENTEALMNYDLGSTRLNNAVFLCISVSCFIAVMFNTIIIIATGSYLFETIPTRRVLMGVALAMCGVLVYSSEVSRQQTTSNDGLNSSGLLQPVMTMNRIIPLKATSSQHTQHHKHKHETHSSDLINNNKPFHRSDNDLTHLESDSVSVERVDVLENRMEQQQGSGPTTHKV